jgi:hypothetical protein
MMGEEKFLFLINTAWNRNRENSGQGLPETVLRVVIEKMSFPGFDGREGTEDQNPGGAVKNRRNRVCDGIHDKYPFRYILNDKIAIHVVL